MQSELKPIPSPTPSPVTRALAVVAIIAMAALLASAPAPAAAADDAKRAKVAELIELTGGAKLTTQMGQLMAQFIGETIKRSGKELTPEMVESINHVVNKKLSADAAEMLAEMQPIYAKHYTSSELDELIAFYKTPIGKKSIDVTPTIMQESAQIAMAWTRRIGPQVQEAAIQQLRDDGLL